MVEYSRIWFVVADGEHARIVARQPHEWILHTVKVLTSRNAGERSHDMGADRPGRTHESVGVARHAVAPRHDPHVMAKEGFVAAVAAAVNVAGGEGAFDHLVLIAPGHALSVLHEALDGPTRKKVVGTLGKDLTKVGDHELNEHMREWL